MLPPPLAAIYETWLARMGVPVESRMVRTFLGATHVLLAGEPDAPPLVLVHGAGMNALVWRGEIAELSREYRVIAPDVPGQTGRSARVRVPPLGNGAGRWLAETMDGVGVRRAPIIGASLGGWIAMKFALAYPDRAERLVLVAPGGIVTVDFQNFVRRGAWEVLLDRRRGYARMIQNMAVKPMAAELLDAVSEALRYQSIRTSVLPLVIGDADMRRIQAPMLAILGKTDFFFPPDAVQARLRRLKPDARIVRLDASDHLIPFDQPEEMMAAIVAFLHEEQPQPAAPQTSSA